MICFQISILGLCKFFSMAFKLQTVTSNFSNDFIFYAVRQVAEAAKMLLRGAGVSGATILRVLGSEQWIQMKCRRDCCRKQTSLEGLCFEQLLFSTNSNKFVCVPNIYFNFIQIMFSICVTNDNRIMIYYGFKKKSFRHLYSRLLDFWLNSLLEQCF